MMFVKLIIVTDENECCNAVISPDLVSSVVFCSAALRCFFCQILASLMKALIVDEELKIQLPYTNCGESYFHFLFAFVVEFCIPF